MRALIVKTSALGDIVQTYPVADYLKTRQQVTHLGWVVESKFASLVKAHPLVDTVIEIDSRLFRSPLAPWSFLREFFDQRKKMQERSWDVVFDLQANCKSGLYTFLANCPEKIGYGKESVAEWPNLLVTNNRKSPPKTLSRRDEYLWLVKNYYQDEAFFESSSFPLILKPHEERMLAQELARWPVQKDVWMIASGSNWPNKMCRTESLKKVLLMVREKYSPYFVFTAGNAEELKQVGLLAEGFSDASHVIYRPELPVLQHVMARAKAVIAVDSLLLHLAATTKTPTFGFFGPSLGKKYAPSGIKNEYFQAACPFDIQFEKRCPFIRTCKEGACLKEADPARIFEALISWYSRP